MRLPGKPLADIAGTPFYLMERLEGRVVEDYAALTFPREQRRAAFESMAATLAALHRLDYAALGLSDYGRTGSYFARQLSRWSGQWVRIPVIVGAYSTRWWAPIPRDRGRRGQPTSAWSQALV